MLYVTDKVAKLGGIYLGGEVTSIEIEEAANIYTAQDEKGKIKTTQPNGYEQAKVTIDILLEDTKKETTLDQVRNMQRLFKAPGQANAKLFKIVNEDCAARGISKVYFKSFTTKKVIAESKRIASLELLAPKIAGVKLRKKNAVAKASETNKRSDNIKSVKNRAKTPARDTRETITGKKAAQRATKN